MKQLNKPKVLKYCLLIFTSFVLLCFSLYLSWILFPSSLAVGTKVIQTEYIESPVADGKSVLAPEPVAVPVPLELPPDYSIPNISNGIAPVVYRISTDQNVVFLGIDDGLFKDQSVIDIMKQNHIKASLFLSKAFITDNPDFFKQLVDLGSFVENHTLSHDTKMVTTKDYSQQKFEICGMADYIQLHYGRRPTLFRPPGGAYSDTLRQAAADCGMKAVVTWIAKANGGSMQYQIGNKLRQGDVVLMHFRPEFKQDMQAFVDAMGESGLHTALLEDAL